MSDLHMPYLHVIIISYVLSSIPFSANMSSNRLRGLQKNVSSSKSSRVLEATELLKKVEEEAAVIRQEMRAQRKTLDSCLLMDPPARGIPISSSHQYIQTNMENREMEVLEFLEQKSGLLKSLREDYTSIRQEMSAQNKIFYTLLQMEPETRHRAIEVLHRMGYSVEEPQKVLSRRRVRVASPDYNQYVRAKNSRSEEELLREVERMTAVNEHLKKAVRRERDERLKAEECFRRERAERKEKKNLKKFGNDIRQKNEETDAENLQHSSSGKNYCSSLNEHGREEIQRKVEERTKEKNRETEGREHINHRKQEEERQKQEERRQNKRREEEKKQKEEEKIREHELRNQEQQRKEKEDRRKKREQRLEEMRQEEDKKQELREKQERLEEVTKEQEMEVALEEKEEEEEEEKKNTAAEEKQEEEEGLCWAVKRTDVERRKDINKKKLKKEWERNSKEASQRETERQLWREHLQRLGESPSSSHSSEKDVQWERTLKSRTCSQKQTLQLQQDPQNQALQAARRAEEIKTEEVLVNKELLRRKEEASKKPKTVVGSVLKFMKKTYQRVVDYSTQNDLNSPYQQHRLRMKKLSQEREKMEKEMLEKLLEKRRKAKEAP
ncbi:hypothetical protein NFI96_024503 [Prochilodus magdalenae]|nr:hypothetical protein NFI96_024503 [Prochilodus magdalenae]